MIIKYDKCNFEKLEIRQLASLTYNILKVDKQHELSKHIWGDSESYFPIDVPDVGVNLDTEGEELYRPDNPYKHQDIWYNISILPNMMHRLRKYNLTGYTIRKIGHQYYWGIHFITNQFKDQIGNPLNHLQISILFENEVDIKHYSEHNCRYFLIPIMTGKNINDTAYNLAETAIDYYSKYHNILVNIVKKHAPKYINHSGYIYE